MPCREHSSRTGEAHSPCSSLELGHRIYDRAHGCLWGWPALCFPMGPRRYRGSAPRVGSVWVAARPMRSQWERPPSAGPRAEHGRWAVCCRCPMAAPPPPARACRPAGSEWPPRWLRSQRLRQRPRLGPTLQSPRGQGPPSGLHHSGWLAGGVPHRKGEVPREAFSAHSAVPRTRAYDGRDPKVPVATVR